MTLEHLMCCTATTKIKLENMETCEIDGHSKQYGGNDSKDITVWYRYSSSTVGPKMPRMLK